MALKMNKMQCPSCGANLEYDGNPERVICTYCGTPIVVTDENKTEIITRNIDEAAIAKEKRKEKELIFAEKSRKQSLKEFLIVISVFGAMAVGTILLYLLFTHI